MIWDFFPNGKCTIWGIHRGYVLFNELSRDGINQEMCPLAHSHGTCPCIEDLLLKVGDFQRHTSNYQMRGIRDVKYDES